MSVGDLFTRRDEAPKAVRRAPGFDLFFEMGRYFGARFYGKGSLSKEADRDREFISVQAGCGYVDISRDELDRMIESLMKLREDIAEASA